MSCERCVGLFASKLKASSFAEIPSKEFGNRSGCPQQSLYKRKEKV